VKTNKDIFVEKLQSFIAKKELLKFSLSSPKDKTSDLKKMIITAVELKKAIALILFTAIPPKILQRTLTLTKEWL